MPADYAQLALVAVIATAPLAITLIIAILRGYTISVHMTREDKQKRE